MIPMFRTLDLLLSNGVFDIFESQEHKQVVFILLIAIVVVLVVVVSGDSRTKDTWVLRQVACFNFIIFHYYDYVITLCLRCAGSQ